MIFACVFSNNVLSTIKSVIHFECSVHLDARKIQPRYALHRFPRSVQLVARMIHKGNEIKCGDFCVCFSNNILSTVKSVIHFVQQVARYDLRPNHARNEIKRGDFCVSFFKQRIINRQERYLFRATSCTLRFRRGYKQRRRA